MRPCLKLKKKKKNKSTSTKLQLLFLQLSRAPKDAGQIAKHLQLSTEPQNPLSKVKGLCDTLIREIFPLSKSCHFFNCLHLAQNIFFSFHLSYRVENTVNKSEPGVREAFAIEMGYILLWF